MHNLIEFSNNYSKTSESLWQYHKDDPNENIVHSESFEFKINITVKNRADANTKDFKIAVPLKYLSNFRRTREISFINCEINLILAWPENCRFFCNWRNKISNKRYKNLHFSCNFINSR